MSASPSIPASPNFTMSCPSELISYRKLTPTRPRRAGAEIKGDQSGAGEGPDRLLPTKARTRFGVSL